MLLAALLAPVVNGPSLTHEAQVPPSASWSDEVELPAGLTAILLEAPGAADADLIVERLSLERQASEGVAAGFDPQDPETLRAASHLARELLLVRGPARVRLRVEAPAGAAFRLTLTASPAQPPALVRDQTLVVGGARRSVLLCAPSRSALVSVERYSGLADLDLAGFDDALCLSRLSETAPGREQLRIGPDVRHVLLVARGPRSVATVTLRRATPPGAMTRFLERLPQTEPQRLAIAALRQHPDFLRILSYLESYPGGMPLELRVVPGLRAHGVERFGTFCQGVLTVNPDKVEHRRNPQELVDTLLHELLHALLAMPRAGGFPLSPEVLDASHDPLLRGTLTSPLRRTRLPATIARYLDAHYGPSASNPEEDFSDINAGAQRLLVKVIRENLRRTGAGSETLVFQNVRAREEGLAK